MFSLNKFIQSGSLIATGNGRCLLGWGKREWLSNPRDTHAPSFYFPDFFLKNPKPWFQQEYYVEMLQSDLLNYFPHDHHSLSIKLKWENQHAHYFQTAFKDLQEKIQENRLHKAVPYVFEMSQVQMTKMHILHALKNMLLYTLTEPLNVYGFWDEQQGILGASPELLFRFKKEQEAILETVACAGTRGHGSPQVSLLDDSKELHEHHLVIKGITESLTHFGDVMIGHTSILKLPRFSHLITPIQVKLPPNVKFEAVVKALHPTPALGAFPRVEGMQWLENYQKLIDRKRYGAPVGFVRHQGHEACCFVAIRNMQWMEDKLFIGAGCGIVKDSQYEREWQEVNLKIQAIKDMFL